MTLDYFYGAQADQFTFYRIPKALFTQEQCYYLRPEKPKTEDECDGYSDDQIVTVALSQVGNVGGEPYWSWYGFGSRVEWCACFVRALKRMTGCFAPKALELLMISILISYFSKRWKAGIIARLRFLIGIGGF